MLSRTSLVSAARSSSVRFRFFSGTILIWRSGDDAATVAGARSNPGGFLRLSVGRGAFGRGSPKAFEKVNRLVTGLCK